MGRKRMAREDKRQPIGISISAEVVKQLDQLCDECELNRSQVIEAAIIIYLDQHRDLLEEGEKDA